VRNEGSLKLKARSGALISFISGSKPDPIRALVVLNRVTNPGKLNIPLPNKNDCTLHFPD